MLAGNNVKSLTLTSPKFTLPISSIIIEDPVIKDLLTILIVVGISFILSYSAQHNSIVSKLVSILSTFTFIDFLLLTRPVLFPPPTVSLYLLPVKYDAKLSVSADIGKLG